MEPRTFDALTRRASLLTLGTAGLAALALPLTGAAKAKKSRKNKNKNKGNVNKRCKTQVGQCEAFVDDFCGDQPECAEQLACCSSLGTCDFLGFIACVEEAQQPTLTGLRLH
jgi:hypothetical protein